jgi:outer membrane murein-binding lipoprotein Lpp
MVLMLAAAMAAGCATAMDMSDTNSQITENKARIERLEKQQAAQQKKAAGETNYRHDR